MIKRLLIVLIGLSASLLPAQNILNEIAESQISTSKERWIVPQRYRTLQLDRVALQTLLNQAPERGAAESARPILSIPLPDGSTARFRLTESSVMAPDLQARYPEIRTFTGQGIDDPSALLKCDWTPHGFHAMLFLTGKSTVFIDPYSLGDTEHYIVYHKKDYVKRASQQDFSCGVEPVATDPEDGPGIPIQSSARSTDGQLRRYRLALACSGEYAAFHGGTRPLALAAMVTTVNRISGVYEREFAVTMELVSKNDSLIYLDGATDPYENGNTGVMLGQNRTVCNARIGGSNYDIGHVYGTHPSVSGLASLQSVCTNSKAQGVSCFNSPVGDPFVIDVVCHEMGHQFGANHTQNNECNRNGGTAVETGSGSTIMSYAGICPPNVQNLSDDYYNGINVAEIVNYIVNGNGNDCPVKTETGNTAPTVSAGPNYIIPFSTPFVLSAQGDDSNGDENQLTYCWEQMDSDAADMPPVSTSALGPLFRTFNPDTSNRRVFPRLQTLVQNQSSTWEVLPSVGRKINFRVTARDNHPAGGHTAQDDMVVTVSNNAGPFRVSGNTFSAGWPAGSWQIVTWDVANTDKAPVNCRIVNIRLSVDGGFTYPVVLASNIPNNGKYCIRVPDITTNKARLLVESADNIFFDINNANFNIAPASAPAFSLCVSELFGQVCLPGAYTATVTTSALSGFDTPLVLSAQGLPPGASAVFTPNPVLPGTDAVLSLTFADGAPEGAIDLTITGTAGTNVVDLNTTITLVSNDFSSLALQSPANGTVGQNENPVLYWQGVPDADAYDVELATNPAFDLPSVLAAQQNTIVDSFKVPVILGKGQVYYWRVRPKNECGAGPWVGPFTFATLVNVCASKNANGLPKTITANQATTVEASVTFTGSSSISDVNVAKIQGSHNFFKEIEVILISPQGTELQLFKGKCGGFSGSFNLGFDDASPSPGPTCPPSNLGVIFRPDLALSKFNGEDASGEWILRVKDDSPGSGGSLSGFTLELCANTTLNPPVLVNNNVLQVAPGNNRAVTPDLLKTEDANNTDDELLYTLLTTPQHGELHLNGSGTAMVVGDQMTQTDLNNGGLRYFHYGTDATPDEFCFTVTDGEGGLIKDCFTIQPFPVGTGEPGRLLEFSLAPNPATESLRITFSEAPRSDTRIRLLDASGRLLRHVLLGNGEVTTLLQVADLPKGIYVVAIDNAAGSGVRKVVVR
jgi:subtilisin-like proprotein convertase family protein